MNSWCSNILSNLVKQNSSQKLKSKSIHLVKKFPAIVWSDTVHICILSEKAAKIWGNISIDMTFAMKNLSQLKGCCQKENTLNFTSVAKKIKNCPEEIFNDL